jgi:hypothetical protein
LFGPLAALADADAAAVAVGGGSAGGGAVSAAAVSAGGFDGGASGVGEEEPQPKQNVMNAMAYRRMRSTLRQVELDARVPRAI